MWGRALAVGQAGPSKCRQASQFLPLIVAVPGQNGQSLQDFACFRPYTTAPRPTPVRPRASVKSTPTAPRASSASKRSQYMPAPPPSRPRPSAFPIPVKSSQPKISGLTVQILDAPPDCPEWPWKLVNTTKDGTQEFSRNVFVRLHLDVSPQLPLYAGFLVCGVIFMFGTLYETASDLEPEAKQRLRENLGKTIGSTFDDGLPIWFYPSLSTLLALLPLGIVFVQGRNIIRLTQVRYQPPNGKPARTVLRMKTPNHMIKIPFTKIYPYPKSRDIDPAKCTIRWSYRGTEEVELNFRTKDTLLTHNYILYFTPTKNLKRDTGEDVVLSVQRLEDIFGKPGEPESQYHTSPTLTHRITEYLTPYKEKEGTA